MLRILPVQEIGQNQHEKGGGLIIRHGRIRRILRYWKKNYLIIMNSDTFPQKILDPALVM